MRWDASLYLPLHPSPAPRTTRAQVNNPPCDCCGGTNTQLRSTSPPTEEEAEHGAGRTGRHPAAAPLGMARKVSQLHLSCKRRSIALPPRHTSLQLTQRCRPALHVCVCVQRSTSAPPAPR